jgi:hypothetical protein
MPSLIPKPPAVVSSDSTHLLPPFLQPGCKITYEHEGTLQGFLGQSKEGVFRFSFKSHINKKSEDWGLPFPNLASTWQDLCVEGILIPGHQSSSFLCIPPLRDGSASHINAVHLKRKCPRSLLSGLHPSHPDCNNGWQVFAKKRAASNPKTRTSRSTSPNTAPFEQKESRRPFLPCVSSPSKRMKCLTLSKRSPASSSLVTMRIASGPSRRNMLPSFAQIRYDATACQHGGRTTTHP